jgi:hypothetical protein
VVEHLPSKPEVLSSNFSTAKEREAEREEGGRGEEGKGEKKEGGEGKREKQFRKINPFLSLYLFITP